MIVTLVLIIIWLYWLLLQIQGQVTFITCKKKKITFRIFNTAFCQKKDYNSINSKFYGFFFFKIIKSSCAPICFYLTCIDDFHCAILTRYFITFISPSTAVCSTVSFLVPTQLIFRVHCNTFSITIHAICNKRPNSFILRKYFIFYWQTSPIKVLRP